VLTLAGRLAAIGAIGTLVLAAALVPVVGPELPDAGRRAVRAASRWALAWAAATLLAGALTLARLVGTLPTALTAESVRAFVELPAGRAVLLVALVAAIVAVLARRCRTAFDAMAVLALAASGVVGPVVTTGHSAAEGDHLLAISTLGVHVLGSSVWVGGLLALLVHGRDREVAGPAAARFSSLALACFAVVGGTGLLAAWIVLGRSSDGVVGAVGSGYGWLLIAKSAALGVLGWFGWRHRRRTLPDLRAGRPRAFRRFAAAEGGVMVATVAVAVALSASPPPGSAATAASAPGSAEPAEAAAPAADPMAGHDHGELSVGVLVDDTRFHVPRPVAAGSSVTVFNRGPSEVTLTADGGAFDVVVGSSALTTFVAPAEPGRYPFGSRSDATYRDVLVVE
jgi:putative copper resistance protein D